MRQQVTPHLRAVVARAVAEHLMAAVVAEHLMAVAAESANL
jgi:hypothetical protein